MYKIITTKINKYYIKRNIVKEKMLRKIKAKTICRYKIKVKTRKKRKVLTDSIFPLPLQKKNKSKNKDKTMTKLDPTYSNRQMLL